MNIDGINGLSVTLTQTSNLQVPVKETNNSCSFKDIQTQDVDKYFVWENEGLWYSISYNSIYKDEENNEKESTNLSEDEIGKIAKSIKYPEEIKNVDYSVKREVSTEIATMDIYDKEDLESAKKLLGFNPKLPLKINDDIIINDSSVGISYDSDIKNNKINYELDSFYSNKKCSITFWEGKTSKEYDDIKKNGYYNQDIGENKEPKKIKGEKLNINNKEVFKEDEKAQGQGSYVSYIWKEDNVYYSVTFFRETENSDEIVKDFVNSKPID